MPVWLDVLVFRTWWRYRPAETPEVAVPYHLFNLFEGCVWFVLAFLVFRRYWTGRRSPLEVAYAVAFITFGLTDFREAYVLQSWLIWLKATNLVVLWKLRSKVIGQYYPASKLY
jgi:hypothetical protein